MKKDSFHYTMARIGNDNNHIYDGDMSICTYVRKVIWGSVLALFITTVLVIAASTMVGGLIDVVATILGFKTLGDVGIVFLGISGSLGTLILYVVLTEKWNEKRSALLKTENTSFIASAYKSYKNKFCFPVEFRE
jgi:hypothetical protein